MTLVRPAWTNLSLAAARCRVRLRATAGDRGDVPGWVLVTIMTAGLVAALWAVAGDMLTDAFASAIQETVGHG
jgi:hypothetical protein